MTKELRSYKAEIRIATGDDGSKTVSGLIPYDSLSVDLGGFFELIAPGAFTDALSADADVLALRDHKSTLLLGRTKSGTLQFKDSPEGLRYSIQLPNTTAGNDLAVSIERGDLDSTSFGFCCVEDDFASTESGLIRTLRKVELFEVSPCSFAAYPGSTVSVRTIPDHVRNEIEQRTAASEAPALDEELETLKLRIAIQQRKK